MNVLRVYHGGRIAAHQERERALSSAGISLVLVAPSNWSSEGDTAINQDAVRTIELLVTRGGDVNRHAYSDPSRLERLLSDVRPDVLDIHEEPFSVAARQWLAAAPPDLPVVIYTAQNVDKRYPPPFATAPWPPVSWSRRWIRRP